MIAYRSSIALALIAVASYADAVETLADYIVKFKDNPAATEWGPTGERVASSAEYSGQQFLPGNDHFYTFHGCPRSTDEVNIAFAPVVETSWTAESEAVVTESPVFGRDSSSYMIPAKATDGGQNMLIKVSPEGEREWVITRDQIGDITFPGTDLGMRATRGLGSTPVVVNNPETGRDMIFCCTWVRAFAVDSETGEILWNTQVLSPSMKVAIDTGDVEQMLAEIDKRHRMFGMNYHPAVDAFITADISGDVVAFDRQTGQQIGEIVMPGAPAKGGENDILGGDGLTEEMRQKLIEVVVGVANDLYLHDGIEFVLEARDISVSMAVLGNGAIIGNQISMDTDTNSLWVAATDRDEADGTVDGMSELGALYRIDLARTSDSLEFNIICHASFMGGTTSTPAVSADGERIYTTDNYGSVIAIKRDCQRAWELDVGEAAVASLAVSSQIGAELYYPTLTSIYKIQENSDRDGAKVEWAADLEASFVDKNDGTKGQYKIAADMILGALQNQLERRLGMVFSKDTISFGASNLDLAVIGANGLMIHSGYGLKIKFGDSSIILPLALNNALYDRGTGEFINGNVAVEENIGAMYTSPEGTIIMGGSGPRRAIVRGLMKAPDFFLPELIPKFLERWSDNLVDFIVPPLTGGITKYGVSKGFDLFARDASCAAMRLIGNARMYSTRGTIGYTANIMDTERLIQQASNAIDKAESKSELKGDVASSLQSDLNTALTNLHDHNLSTAENNLNKVCSVLNSKPALFRGGKRKT